MVHYPKVSIVIPVYNGSDYMRDAIDSALAQTYKNIEIIVINDGSNDDGKTHGIALSYGDKISYFKKENGGVATALNLGIEQMTGDYFSWLSHDDLYNKDKIEKQLKKIKRIKDKSAIIFSDWSAIDENNKLLYSTKMKYTNPNRMQYNLLREQILHGCTLLIPKRAFEECGLFTEDLPTTQDYVLWLRFAEKYKFIYIPRVLLLGRQHSAQGSKTLEHRSELKLFFSNEIERMTIEKLNLLFPKRQQAKACALLYTSLGNRGFTDVAEKFEKQIIGGFSDKEYKKYKYYIEKNS